MIKNVFIRFNIMYLSLITLLFSIYSCNDNDFTLGEKFIEQQTNVILYDTLTIKTSTILIDSMQTSGDSLILLGYYYNNYYGGIKASSFFQFDIPENIDIDEDDVFDSVTIYLKYTGYYYGDTTQTFGFSIHQLINEIENYADDDILYNTIKVPYNESTFASYTTIPNPGIADTLKVRLPDDFGSDLFNKLLTSDESVSTEALFLDYFPGIALIPDTTYTKSIIGFRAAPEDLVVRLHYHRYEKVLENINCDFPMTNVNMQYNQISHNFTGTKLDSLVEQRYSLPSSKTDNLAFFQGGIGLIPKIQFPSLSNMLYVKSGLILKAELIIRPQRDSYYGIDLPEKLLLYGADKYNYFSSVITNSSGDIEYATFYLDDKYYESTRYVFDISNYVISELEDGIYDSNTGLVIVPSSGFANNLTSMILECNNPGPQLKIYYATYE